MIVSTAPARKLGLPIYSVNGRLRLVPFRYPEACHGYACGCRCKECEPPKKPKATKPQITVIDGIHMVHKTLPSADAA